MEDRNARDRDVVQLSCGANRRLLDKIQGDMGLSKKRSLSARLRLQRPMPQWELSETRLGRRSCSLNGSTPIDIFLSIFPPKKIEKSQVSHAFTTRVSVHGELLGVKGVG